MRMVWRVQVSVLLLAHCVACGGEASSRAEQINGARGMGTSVRWLDSELHPRCQGTLFDGIVELEVTDEPYQCTLTFGPFDPEDGREYSRRIEFHDADGKHIFGWAFTWLDSFLVRDHILYRATQENFAEPPPRENWVVAFDLRAGGRELWRTEFHIPLPDPLGGIVTAVSRVQLELDARDDLVLSVCGVGSPPQQYVIDKETGSLSPPRSIESNGTSGPAR